jgi:pantetheine-phosphate adenylyltransferase
MAIALYPGTFDPIHNGHIDIATRAASVFDELVVGVYDRPSKKLLFTTEERMAMAAQALQHIPNIRVMRYAGLTVHLAQQIEAQVIVRGLRAISDFEFEFQLALTNKRMAPSVETIGFMTSQAFLFLSSTILKEVALLDGPVSDLVPPHVEVALRERLHT